MKTHELIDKNPEQFRLMVKAGLVSVTIMTQYSIYCCYSGCRNIKSKMNKYYFVSESMKVSFNTVRNAIKNMEKNV